MLRENSKLPPICYSLPICLPIAYERGRRSLSLTPRPSPVKGEGRGVSRLRDFHAKRGTRMKSGMSTRYETDVVAWASEQAKLIRAGRFDLLDLEHIAEEIEDVGRSEQRELANRMAVLLAHLLKWQYQPERRGVSWTRTLT